MSALSAKIENLVIIGSGPAGYTAGIYAARANLKPLLITGFQRGGIPGGQLMTTTFVENFPGFPNGVKGPELMDLLKAQAVRWGTELIEADADEIDITQRPFQVTVEGKKIFSHSTIIATGARANRLKLPNEEIFWSNGISACAICDGATPQFLKEELAVVGGGDSACEEAIYLTKYGSHVHLLVRSNRLKASAALADRLNKNTNISIHWETEVVGIDGKDWLSSILIKTKGEQLHKKLKIKGLFYAIGHTPNTELLKNQLNLDSNGYIITNPGKPSTSIEGVFAAGDVADSEWRQGVTAAGSGCKAALSAERWLTMNNLSRLITRSSETPKRSKTEEKIPTSNKENYNPKAIWQKGNYALRKLYHESNSPLLVIFTSKTCGPCHVLKPQIKRVLEELEGKAHGIEIDIEKDFEIAKQAGIKGTPTVQLFLNKSLKEEWMGVKQRSVFLNALNKLIA